MLRPWDQGGRAVGVRAAVHSLASEITLIKSIRTAGALSPVGQSSTSRAENNTLLFTDLSLSTFVFHFVQNEVNNGRDTCSSVASLPVGWLPPCRVAAPGGTLLLWVPFAVHFLWEEVNTTSPAFEKEKHLELSLLLQHTFSEMSKTSSFTSFPILGKIISADATGTFTRGLIGTYFHYCPFKFFCVWTKV